MPELVTIAAFHFPEEAEVQRLLLENQGIQTFLADANLVGTDWFFSNAVGGVKLQVAAADAARAQRILEEQRAATADPNGGTTKEEIRFACQECGKPIAFPRKRRGHVEECPHCHEFVDVPNESDPKLRSEDNPCRTSGAVNDEEGPLPSDVRFGFLSQGFGIAGLICMVVSALWAWQNETALSEYSATTTGRRVHYVSYEYMVDGITYTTAAPSSRGSPYPDAIVIHYNPRSPMQCIAGTIAPAWVVLAIGFGVGIFLMFVAYQFRYPSVPAEGLADSSVATCSK